MKKFYLLIFLLTLLIKKMNSYCYKLWFSKKYYCSGSIKFCYKKNENECESKHCLNCVKCGEEIRCLDCLEGYYLSKDEKSCITKEAGSTDKIDEDTNSKDQQNCNTNCEDCFSSINDNDMNCISCKSNFYKINGTNNCVDNSVLSQGFYFKNNAYYFCDGSCLTCSDGKNQESNNCLTCDNENEGLYMLADKNNCEYSNFSGYYLNTSENILKKCYERCLTCNQSGNFINMNCLSCKTNFFDSTTSRRYKLILTSKGNCIEECKDGLYFTKEEVCEINCTSDYKKFSFNHTCV